MTAGQFREVDLDLLADYVGGALDGTSAKAAVDQLIRTEPRWRDAHEALVLAMDPVRETLTRWGAEQLAMPDDVTARLTTVLGASLSVTGPVGVPAERISPEGATDDHAVTGNGAADQGRRPGSDGRGPAGPAGRSGPGGRSNSPGGSAAARRRRWGRLAGPTAAAAAVVAFSVLGYTWLASQSGGQHGADSTAGRAIPPAASPEQAQDNAGEPGILLDSAPEQLLTSGIDYTPATLLDAIADLPRLPASAKQSKDPGRSSGAPGTFGTKKTPGTQSTSDPRSTPDVASGEGSLYAGSVPPALRRLADRTALTTCLAAVTAEHGQGQITVQTVDYASFEGRPALMVVFVDGAGARWAWVTGPDCGLPGLAADTRHLARVG